MALTIRGTVVRDKICRVGEDVARLAGVWVQDLISFVPAGKRARWAQALGLRGPLVIGLDLDGGFREVHGSHEPLSLQEIASRTRTRALVLRIEEGRVLRRRLDLPSAVAARLDSALDINLQTWTPFDAEEVYAVASPMAEGAQPSTLQAVELRCVLRSGIADRMEALQCLGLDPDAIELGETRFLLPRPTLKRRTTRRRLWLATSLTLLLFVQGITAYAMLANHQRDEIAQLEAAHREYLGALRQQAKADKDATARQDDMRRMAARLEDRNSFSQALHHLGMVLPQDAMIQEFEANRDRAGGHAVILGPPDMDVAAILATTGFYRVGDLSVQPGTDAGRRTFFAGFTVIPWLQANERGPR